MASTPPAKFRDDIVIIVTLIGCFFGAVFLRWNRDDIEPIFITLFLGVAVAALTYRYLGGTDGSTFQIAALKLGGSAALLAGITFLVSEVMENQRDWIKTDTAYQARLKDETEEATKELKRSNAESISDLNRDHAQAINDLNREHADAVAVLNSEINRSEGRVLDKLRDPNNSALISEVLGIFRSPTGPLAFNALTTAKAINNGSISRTNTVSLCSKHIKDIFQSGVVGNEISVRSGSGEPFNVRLRGTIGADVCANDRFSMQLSCDVSKRLFPEFIAECSGKVPRVSSAGETSLNDDGQLVLKVSLGRPINQLEN